MDLYDEFGNFIGDAMDSDAESVEEIPEQQVVVRQLADDVDMLVETEDTQTRDTPLVQPFIQEVHIVQEEAAGDYLLESCKMPEKLTTIAVIGPLHSGKTSFVEMMGGKIDKSYLETERQVSVRPHACTVLMTDLDGVSRVVNMIDTPGHSGFVDEATVVLPLVDSVVVVVDVVEGLTLVGKDLVNLCSRLEIPVSLVINKIDRLPLEMRLPPQEAFQRVSAVVEECGVPLDRVTFASTKLGMHFSLASWARLYNTDADLWPVFVSYIMEPWYKLVTNTLTMPLEELRKVLPSLQLTESDPEPLLKQVMSQFFHHTAFLNTIVRPEVSQVAELRAVCTKIVESGAMVRILGGSLSKGERVTVWGSNYTNDDDDKHTFTIEELILPGQGTVSCAYQGQIVLVKGWDHIGSIGFVNSPPATISSPVFKVVIAPKNPSELPKLLSGLRHVSKLYTSLVAKVEESGEHTLYGTGELMMDCVMYDLRQSAGIAIKISNPIAKFHEGVVGSSFAKIDTASANGKNVISIVCEPMPKKPQNTDIPKRELAKLLREYGWDPLMARNVLAFEGENCIVNDTAPTMDMSECSEAIVQGFKWAVKEGPLCDEPVHGVCFKILSLDLDANVSSSQIVPMVRKACYAAIMTAQPKILEPYYKMSIVATEQCTEIAHELVAKRRGKLLGQREIPGTPFVEILGQVPVMDSMGLETDLRLSSQGQAMCQFMFGSYRLTPGNPLEEGVLPKLKPAPVQLLGRDFMLKTRARKGLVGEPSLQKYVTKQVYEKLTAV